MLSLHYNLCHYRQLGHLQVLLEEHEMFHGIQCVPLSNLSLSLPILVSLSSSKYLSADSCNRKKNLTTVSCKLRWLAPCVLNEGNQQLDSEVCPNSHTICRSGLDNYWVPLLALSGTCPEAGERLKKKEEI